MSVAKITICNEIYLTFVEHIKFFSALDPNYCVSLMKDQRKSSEGFLLVFTCNFNECLLKLLGSKKDAKKYHNSIIKAHHGTCALFQVFEQETESEVITDKNISASIVLLETSSQGLWSNPSLSHLFSMNRLIQLTHRSEGLIHRAGGSGSGRSHWTVICEQWPSLCCVPFYVFRRLGIHRQQTILILN